MRQTTMPHGQKPIKSIRIITFFAQFPIMTTFIKENNNNVQQFVQFYWTLLMDYVETKKGK